MSEQASRPARPSRWMSYFFSLVGVLMCLGGGALLVVRVIESTRAPEAPLPVAAIGLARAVHDGASWVAIQGVAVPCTYPDVPAGTSSATFRILTDSRGVIVGLAQVPGTLMPCADAVVTLTGTARVLSLRSLELPHDAEEVIVRSTGDEVVEILVGESPRLTLTEIALCLSMALMGAAIAWFYLLGARERDAVVRLAPRSVRPRLPLLPQRPLELAAAYRTSPVIAVAFMGAAALLFAALTAGSWPGLAALDVLSGALVVFLGTMTLALAGICAMALYGSFRARRTFGPMREWWAPVLRHEAALAKGVDVGNRALAYQSPVEDRVVEVILGANEALPWVVEGHVLVVQSEGDAALHVVREDGGPFALTDAELDTLAAKH